MERNNTKNVVTSDHCLVTRLAGDLYLTLTQRWVTQNWQRLTWLETRMGILPLANPTTLPSAQGKCSDMKCDRKQRNLFRGRKNMTNNSNIDLNQTCRTCTQMRFARHLLVAARLQPLAKNFLHVNFTDAYEWNVIDTAGEFVIRWQIRSLILICIALQ